MINHQHLVILFATALLMLPACSSSQGPKGDQGEAGQQGPKGDQGEAGQQGPKGDQGEAGQQGPKGDQGEAGQQGPTGSLAELQARTDRPESIYMVGRVLAGDGGEGLFIWNSENLSSQVAADPLHGIYIPPSTDTTGVSGAWVRADYAAINVLWFGAKGDDATDNLAQFRAATNMLTANHSTLLIPGGEYVISADAAATLFELPEGSKIAGEGIGNTVLKVKPGAADGNTLVFEPKGANVGLYDMTIFLEGISMTYEFAIFNFLHSNCGVYRVEMIGDHTMEHPVVAGKESLVLALILEPLQPIEGVYIEDCVITGFRRAIHNSQTITYAHDITRLRFIRNKWYNNYYMHINLNPPISGMNDVLIDGNEFGDVPGKDDASSIGGIMLAVGSTTNMRIVNNYLHGKCLDAIHLEEKNFNVVVSGNTFEDLDKNGTVNPNGGKAIWLSSNNQYDASGVDVPPRNIVITGNSISGKGTAYSKYGIRSAPHAASLDTDTVTENVVIADNVIEAFETGISMHSTGIESIANNIIRDCETGMTLPDGDDNIVSGAPISGNIIINSTTALIIKKGWPGIKDNVFRSCTNGIEYTYESLIGKHSFYNVPNMVVSTGNGTSTTARLDLLGFYVEKTGVAIAAGTPGAPVDTVVDITQWPTVCYGNMTVVIADSDIANYETKIRKTYAVQKPTSATVDTAVTEHLAGGGGTITDIGSGPHQFNTGYIGINVRNTGGALSTTYLQVDFDGTYSLN